MSTRIEIIKKLLTTFHLNVVDRKLLADESIKISEVVKIIHAELQHHSIFPSAASVWIEDTSVFEGYFIEKTTDNRYKLHWQRHFANNPMQLAEKIEENFTDINQTVDTYIGREHSYKIDGLAIVG